MSLKKNKIRHYWYSLVYLSVISDQLMVSNMRRALRLMKDLTVWHFALKGLIELGLGLKLDLQ